MENNKPVKKQLPAYLVLGIIAIVAAVVLAATNLLTKGTIAEHDMAALKDAFNAVMPAESYEQLTVPGEYDVSSLYAAKNGDAAVGYCVTAVGKGYNGDVAVTLGVDTDGMVTGCQVGDSSFAETAGFGARAREEAFQSQFAGIDAVNGGSFEALSGATVTSTAVLNAVNAALKCVDEVALGKTAAVDPIVIFGEKQAAAPKPQLTGAVQSASAKGFASDVKVDLTLDDSGAISSLTIDSTGETEGFGQRAMTDEAFQSQFIGKTGPFTLGENVDALSGATVTSTAVVEAVNAAMAAPASAAGDALTGTAKGFQSDVNVTVTMDGDAIASITIDSTGETEGFGQRAMTDEAFQSQFAGKTAPLTLGGNIDALSGATVTSTAVVDAANQAMASAGASADEPATVVAEDANATLGVKTDGSAVLTVNSGFTGTADVSVTVEGGKVTTGTVASKLPSSAEKTDDGKATATAKGFQSNVRATLTLAEDGSIADLALGTAKETEYIGQLVANNKDFVNQFMGKTAPFTLGDGIDAVSGATVTSTAAVAAINDAAAFAKDNGLTAAATAEVPVAEVPVAEAPAADAQTATAKGFQSDVTVTVTFDDAGAIATLAIDSNNETDGFGKKATTDEAFASQFIGKTLPLTLGDGVDAISGATVTSTAVVTALNSLAAAPAEEAEAKAEVPVAEAPAADAQTATAKGFQSDVTVTVTFDDAGAIATLAIDSNNETDGFGKKATTDEAFISQFIGKTLPLTLGDGVDAISGATVTSTAVVTALNSLAAAPAEEAEAKAEEPVAEAPAADAKTATAKGFQSDVTVTVTFDDAGAIATLAIDSNNETDGFGKKATTDEAFASQFIGKTLPLTLGDGVDAISGATVTSTAVVTALNSLAAAPAEEAPATEAPAAEAPAADAQTATAKGFQSDVTVTVTFDDAGAIATLAIDSNNETDGFGKKATTDEAFASQFIGKTLPLTLGDDVDAISGATVTSTAVVTALNSLAAAPAEEAAATEAPAAEAPVAEAPAADAQTATAKGFQSDVTVTVTFDDAGAIATLAIDADNETDGYGKKASTDEAFISQFVGKTLPLTLGEDVDALSGATITSTVVVRALNSLAK